MQPIGVYIYTVFVTVKYFIRNVKIIDNNNCDPTWDFWSKCSNDVIK